MLTWCWQWCWQKSKWLLLGLIGLWLFFDFLSYLVAESLWFQEIGYFPAFLLRLQTWICIWAIAFGITTIFLLINLRIATKLKYFQAIAFNHQNSQDKLPKLVIYPPLSASLLPLSPSFHALNLQQLLITVISLSFLVGCMVLHYGKIAISYWYSDVKLENFEAKVPPIFEPETVLSLILQIPDHIFMVGLLLGISILLIINPEFWLRAIAILFSLGFGFILSKHWTKLLLFSHSTPFNNNDPIFQQDISFYIFKFPLWELIEFWLGGLFLFALIAVALIYLLAGDSISNGYFPGFSLSQRRHLNGLGGCLMLVVALHYWLLRYQLLYSTLGVSYGAGYTDIKIRLPAYTILTILGAIIGFFLLWRTIFLPVGKGFSLFPKIGAPRLIYGLGLYLIIAILSGYILPEFLQKVIVQPNELDREKIYIDRSIVATRKGFNLDKIEAQIFNPEGKLTYTDLQKNDLTIRNIRLWDTKPLLETNRQLQQIRPYYKFPDADIDRYSLQIETNPTKSKPATDTEKQQVILAGRELDYNAVPQEAKTWVNEHLVYTHGYGFTVSPVNTVAPGGLPEYFVKDIGIDKTTGKTGYLRTSSASISDSIPVGHPRIYYGEITDTYIMTPSQEKEFDYPQGDENAYNIYSGSGGVSIGSLWQRLIFAKYLKDWQMLFTQNFTKDTKVLFRRNIKQRIKYIAPFLQYDSNPYLVIADINKQPEKLSGISSPKNEEPKEDNYLYWMIDAYTTSDRYPYSEPVKNNNFNYIRNSVKIVVDAYNGNVTFYIADFSDPMIKSWQTVFPGLFKPISEMPVHLRSHIRYPVDLFSIQSERLLNYHMKDAQVFYNREDQWQIPTEIYGSKPKVVEPYYLIMKLPMENTEEFILLLPFTPTKRTNLIAWLAARSDEKEYGKLLLYEFPKQKLIYGIEQIEALINQNPAISQQISLWNRQGSRALQGNLLVIPIEKSLLYVEPLYLEAEQNSLPTLVRVIVIYENRIVMAENLEQGLKEIFQTPLPKTPPIVRPVR